MLYIND